MGQRVLLATFDHPSVSATTSWKFSKQRFGCKVEAVNYLNKTGLAAHSTDNFKASLLNGATSIATLFDTDADDGALLAADTFVAGTLSGTPANLVLAAGDNFLLTATMEGTATLPAGRIEVWGEVL